MGVVDEEDGVDGLIFEWMSVSMRGVINDVHGLCVAEQVELLIETLQAGAMDGDVLIGLQGRGEWGRERGKGVSEKGKREGVAGGGVVGVVVLTIGFFSAKPKYMGSDSVFDRCHWMEGGGARAVATLIARSTTERRTRERQTRREGQVPWREASEMSQPITGDGALEQCSADGQ